jgi:hypothetical protein
MKTLNVLILALILACNIAMAQDTLYIYKSGLPVEKLEISKIDSITFRTVDTQINYPTDLITPTSADILDNSIRLKWTVTSNVYTRIDVCVNNTVVTKSVSLTTSDNTAGLKVIEGLQPSTTYYLKIYVGDVFKGEKVVKTIAAQKYVGDVVDLRGYSNDASLNLISQTFIDSISAAHQSGYNLLLKGGTKYIIGTVILPVKINIVTGLSFGGKAVLAINSCFSAPASTTVSKIRFEKVFFDQGTIAGKLKTDGNYGATYALNFNMSDGNVDSLIIENCDIKYKRGFIRMQTSARINSITVNNCLFDSIAGYGVINNANAASYIGNIVFKNSTVLHADKIFVGGQTLGINSITVDHVTTCYSPSTTSGYFLDYNSNAVPGGISVSNSLFGIGSAGATVNGYRAAAGANVTVTNCYKTSDLTWNNPFTGVTDLGLTTTQTFAAPTTSNYKVTDSKLVNLVGDSRWW